MLQALFVLREGTMFIQEGYYLDAQVRGEWPLVLECICHVPTGVMDDKGQETTKSFPLFFDHGVVNLPGIKPIHVYVEQEKVIPA